MEDHCKGIEQRARQLCVAEHHSCQGAGICDSVCRAVVPDERLLVKASRQLFKEYWQARGHAPGTLRRSHKLSAAWVAVKLWWRDRRTPDAPLYPGYKLQEDVE